MGFLDLLVIMEKINRQAEREQLRRDRINAKIEANNRREFERQQQIIYVNNQISMSDNLTNEILNQYRNYNDFLIAFLSSKRFFYFDSFKQKYDANQFFYNKPVPQRKNDSEKIKIPKEGKLENTISFFKNRRIKAQEKKVALENKEVEEYNLLMNRYEYEKNLAYEQFKKNEEQRKNNIENFNQAIENWKSGCKAYDKACIDGFLARIFNYFSNITKDKIVNKIKYDYSNRKLILEVFLKKEKDMFPCEGYRYYKQRDVIEPINTKKTTINRMLKDIIPNVAISFLDLLYKNDELFLFEEIIVNVFYDRKCCSSIDLTRDLYFTLNLLNEDNYYYVYDNYMKNYKTLSTGVKPYESIYMELK